MTIPFDNLRVRVVLGILALQITSVSAVAQECVTGPSATLMREAYLRRQKIFAEMEREDFLQRTLEPIRRREAREATRGAWAAVTVGLAAGLLTPVGTAKFMETTTRLKIPGASALFHGGNRGRWILGGSLLAAPALYAAAPAVASKQGLSFIVKSIYFDRSKEIAASIPKPYAPSASPLETGKVVDPEALRRNFHARSALFDRAHAMTLEMAKKAFGETMTQDRWSSFGADDVRRIDARLQIGQARRELLTREFIELTDLRIQLRIACLTAEERGHLGLGRGVNSTTTTKTLRPEGSVAETTKKVVGAAKAH
jgi:hypothetical protein